MHSPATPAQSVDGSGLDSGKSAYLESIAMLEYPRLRQCVSQYAATEAGRRWLVSREGVKRVASLTRAESERLLALTRQALLLERTCSASPLEALRHVQHVDALLPRIARQGMLEGVELLAVARTMHAAQCILRATAAAVCESDGDGDGDGEHRRQELEEFAALVARLRPSAAVEKEIYRCLDDDGRVRDAAAPELSELRGRMREVASHVRSTLQRVAQQRGAAMQERTPTMRYDRYVLSVKATHKARVPGITHDYSASGNTVFVEPREAIDANAELRRLLRQEAKVEQRICQALSEHVHAVGERFADTYAALVELDLTLARARFSAAFHAVEPRFSDDGDAGEHGGIDMRRVLHPLLLWQAPERSSVVPIDFVVRSGTRAAVITGANTGGKTLAEKTLGLAALMAKSGLFVPVANDVPLDTVLTMPHFDRVLADIGDEQSLQQNLSTFSGHIERVKEILAEVTPRSLVLLDELGAGTDPLEGAALGMALLRHLVHERRAGFTFATTHHGELKSLKYADPARFENASVQFDDERLVPTYRLLWGIPGRSNALQIARRLSFDERILADAESLIDSAGHGNDGGGSGSSGSSRTANEMIAVLEKLRLEQEERLEQARADAAAAERMRDEAEASLMAAREREEQLREREQRGIEEALAEARREVAAVIRRLQQGHEPRGDGDGGGGRRAQTAEAAAAATAELDALAGKYGRPAASSDSGDVSWEAIQPGALVIVPRLGPNAVQVLSAPNAKGEVGVQLGRMKAKVRAAEVQAVKSKASGPAPSGASAGVGASARPRPQERKAGSKRPPQHVAAPSGRRTVVRTATNTLDIRGCRVEESASRIEQAIERSMALGSLWLIHGFGTGSLKRGARAILDEHPSVERYEDAEQHEGGGGVSVVYLK